METWYALSIVLYNYVKGSVEDVLHPKPTVAQVVGLAEDALRRAAENKELEVQLLIYATGPCWLAPDQPGTVLEQKYWLRLGVPKMGKKDRALIDYPPEHSLGEPVPHSHMPRLTPGCEVRQLVEFFLNSNWATGLR